MRLSQNELFERMCAWEDAEYIMAASTRAGSDKHDHEGIVDGHVMRSTRQSGSADLRLGAGIYHP